MVDRVTIKYEGIVQTRGHLQGGAEGDESEWLIRLFSSPLLVSCTTEAKTLKTKFPRFSLLDSKCKIDSSVIHIIEIKDVKTGADYLLALWQLTSGKQDCGDRESLWLSSGGQSVADEVWKVDEAPAGTVSQIHGYSKTDVATLVAKISCFQLPDPWIETMAVCSSSHCYNDNLLLSRIYYYHCIFH